MPRLGNGFYPKLDPVVARRFGARFLRTVLLAAWDVVVFLPPLRWLARAIKARDLALLSASEFDRAFYLQQFRSRRRRRMAAADPSLHYAVIGRWEARAPSLRFDPIFYRARTNRLKGNPFLHFLASGDTSGTPQNETDARLGSLPVSPGSAPGVLVFHHARGGGSTKFLTIFEKALVAEHYAPIRLRKVAHSDRLVVLDNGRSLELHDLVDGLDALHRSLSTMNIERILVSHVVDFNPTRIFDVILRTARALSSPIDVILHDYICVCPRINLVDHKNATCLPIPPASRCRPCLDGGGGDIGDIDPSAWRQQFAQFLDSVDRVIVPSGDMKTRLAPHLRKPLIVWQPERETPTEVRPRALARDGLLRIVVVGGLNFAKGSKVVAGLGAAIQATGAPVQIDLIGESPDHAMLSKAGVKIHGRFNDEDLADLLRRRDPHVAFLPAIWPETWSFVLTQLMARGLPVFAFDLGAQSERLRALGRPEFLLDPTLIERPTHLLDIFLKFRTGLIRKSHTSGQLR